MANAFDSPPRWAERLLRWSLAPDERAAVLGDVQEEFAAIAEDHPGRAARWYWRQTLTSVLSNIVRQIRNQWAEARTVINDEDRRARRRRMIFGVAWMSFIAAIFASMATLKPGHEWLEDGLIFAIPGPLLALSSLYRPGFGMSSQSRRSWLIIGAYITWNALNFLHRAQGLVWTAQALAVLLWMWPRAMWPFRRELRVRGYSVRSPVMTSLRPATASFGTVIVPPEPWAMSPAIVGWAEPPVPVAGGWSDGVVPLLPVPAKSFTSGDLIRVFGVVNADPNGLHATLEISRADAPRAIASIPATVALATPRLPYRHPYGIDGDSELPRLSQAPMSELNATVSLAGLASGQYILRLTATSKEGFSSQNTEIKVWMPGGSR